MKKRVRDIRRGGVHSWHSFAINSSPKYLRFRERLRRYQGQPVGAHASSLFRTRHPFEACPYFRALDPVSFAAQVQASLIWDR